MYKGGMSPSTIDRYEAYQLYSDVEWAPVLVKLQFEELAFEQKMKHPIELAKKNKNSENIPETHAPKFHRTKTRVFASRNRGRV